jgi:U3 small nucleolar RNA-associated protein 14
MEFLRGQPSTSHSLFILPDVRGSSEEQVGQTANTLSYRKGVSYSRDSCTPGPNPWLQRSKDSRSPRIKPSGKKALVEQRLVLGDLRKKELELEKRIESLRKRRIEQRDNLHRLLASENDRQVDLPREASNRPTVRMKAIIIPLLHLLDERDSNVLRFLEGV